MSWEVVTAFAAIGVAIAAVISLQYVARQMKAATRQRKIEAYHAILGRMDDFGKLLAQDDSSSDIWWRASKGLARLTDAERVRYFGMLSVLFRSWENAFHYHIEGDLEDWRTEVMTKNLADITTSGGVQEYWALRKRWYTTDFQHWVDDQIKQRSGVDVYGDQFRVFGSAEERDSQ